MNANAEKAGSESGGVGWVNFTNLEVIVYKAYIEEDGDNRIYKIDFHPIQPTNYKIDFHHIKPCIQ